MDEAGSRVHISNIVVPDQIVELEKDIEQTKQDKIQAVKNQNFEKAASYRDKEKELLDKLDSEKRKWEKELSLNRETVDEEKVAEVVAMMTGVPVQRIAQAEGTRLLKMAEEMKGSVIGQDEAIIKVVKNAKPSGVMKKNDLANYRAVFREPLKYNYKDFGTCSPTNLRYIYQSMLILKFMKEKLLNNVNVIEIGGGYGGLCFFYL